MVKLSDLAPSLIWLGLVRIGRTSVKDNSLEEKRRRWPRSLFTETIADWRRQKPILARDGLQQGPEEEEEEEACFGREIVGCMLSILSVSLVRALVLGLATCSNSAPFVFRRGRS